jgi:hypothetical protein
MGVLGILSAFGLSASAGLNAYIPLLVIALMARFTNLIKLNSPWDTLSSWWIIGLLVLLSAIEFAADKIPVVNHINDIIQTLIRPTAGAIAFAASANVITGISPVLALGIGLIMAGTVHVTKAVVVRPTVTTLTAGAGNIPVSVTEDVISTLVSILSIIVPALGVCLLIIVTAWIVWRIKNRPRVYKRA